jgi:hypothetical protein
MGLMKAPMTFSPRLIIAALLAAALFACCVPQARAAVHWPGFGGDAGRSGNQPLDAGAAPVAPVWKQDDGVIRTSPLISGGPAAQQRVMYGTEDGVVHLRRLSDGSAVGAADIGSADEVFGTQNTDPGEDGSVSFVDTSTESALGQLFVVHNEADGIEIAHFDEADGSLVQQFDVPGTAGMTIESSPVATADALFFVADGRLFRVAVADAQSPDAAFGTVTSRADADATPLASPALLYLDLLGTPTAHIAIGGADGELRTYRAADLADEGPSIALPPAREVLTPVVPVQPDGRTPSPGSPVQTPPAFYVSATSDENGGYATGLFKLRQDPADESLFELVTMAVIPGLTSPAMAVAQVAEPETEDGKLAVGLDFNLFLFSTRDFDSVGSFDTLYSLVGGDSGFQQTTAAVSGDYVYVANDRGRQWVVRVSDGKAVVDEGEDAEFLHDADNEGVVGQGVGQPAISRGFVVFGGPDGVFAYRNTDATDPTVELTTPADGATASGPVEVSATAADARGIAQVEFFANGRSIGADAVAPYAVTLDPGTLAGGEYVLDARATDSAGRTAISAPRRLVVPARGDDAPPTVSFTSPAAGARLRGTPVLRATASDDRGVASVRFLAGDRVICTDTAAPYDCRYRLTAEDVGRTTLVAVAGDGAGQTGTALRNVTVRRFVPRSVSAKTTRRDLRFTTRGVVRMPAGVTRAQGCASGDVSVVIKAGRKTISARRVRLTRTCTYRSRVTFASRKRFPASGRLTVRTRFPGNAVLAPRRAATATIRTR